MQLILLRPQYVHTGNKVRMEVWSVDGIHVKINSANHFATLEYDMIYQI